MTLIPHQLDIEETTSAADPGSEHPPLSHLLLSVNHLKASEYLMWYQQKRDQLPGLFVHLLCFCLKWSVNHFFLSFTLSLILSALSNSTVNQGTGFI